MVALARPSKLVRLGDFVVVGLSRLSAGFDAIGPGMVAFVDLEKRSVRGVAIEGLQNCSQVVPVPDDATRVAVACAGFLHADPRPDRGSRSCACSTLSSRSSTSSASPTTRMRR